MRRHAAVVVLVLTLAGCAEPVDLAAEDTSTATSSTPKKPKPKPSPSKVKAAEKKAAEPISADMRKYLEENFTGTSWVDNIKAVEKNSGQDWVSTNLKATDRDRASKICSAISGYQLHVGTGEFKGVRVSAATGERIVWRKTIGETC